MDVEEVLLVPFMEILRTWMLKKVLHGLTYGSLQNLHGLINGSL
jgi:hypothetical protein